jgi:hypothetical protein
MVDMVTVAGEFSHCLKGQVSMKSQISRLFLPTIAGRVNGTGTDLSEALRQNHKMTEANSQIKYLKRSSSYSLLYFEVHNVEPTKKSSLG